MAQAKSERRSIGQLLGVVLLNPPRLMLALMIGSSMLAAQAVRRTVDHAIEEGERRLARLSWGSLVRRTEAAARR